MANLEQMIALLQDAGISVVPQDISAREFSPVSEIKVGEKDGDIVIVPPNPAYDRQFYSFRYQDSQENNPSLFLDELSATRAVLIDLTTSDSYVFRLLQPPIEIAETQITLKLRDGKYC